MKTFAQVYKDAQTVDRAGAWDRILRPIWLSRAVGRPNVLQADVRVHGTSLNRAKRAFECPTGSLVERQLMAEGV